jgi:hypothetical protein
MNIYPHIHFIGNQGTYTLDTSIKITPKSPAPFADDRPIIMGTLFVLHKFKFYFIYIASPKLKNLYFSLTASLYAFKINSRDASDDTSIISVDSGNGN